jgi:hypothetical protein
MHKNKLRSISIPRALKCIDANNSGVIICVLLLSVRSRISVCVCVCVCVCVRYPLCWMMFEKGQHRMGERVLLRYCIRLGFDLNALQICICLPVRCHAWTCVRRIDWLVGCATIRFATGAFTRLDMYVCQILFAFDLLPVRLRAWICMYVKCCLLLICTRCGFAPGYVCKSNVVCF